MRTLDRTESHRLLGNAALSDDELTGIARQVLAEPTAQIDSWWVETVDYVTGTPSTGALLRVCGTAHVADGGTRAWSTFVKVLRSTELWPHLHRIPADYRGEFIEQFPWRLEITAHESGVGDLLPAEMRLPRHYRVVEIDTQHAAIWMEDVEPATAPWEVERFARAARALGELAARRRPGLVEPFRSGETYAVPNAALRYYVQSRVALGALPALRQEETWRHPVLAQALEECGEASLPVDLLSAAERIDATLDRLDLLPQTFAHGDASPQNLLVSASDPDRFVVIDWGFDSPHAVGFDLGQLLIGLAHAGELSVDELPTVDEAITAAYEEGLRAGGMRVRRDEIRYGYVASMLLRAAFTSLPIDQLAAPGAGITDEVRALWRSRVRLTRYLLDLAASL